MKKTPIFEIRQKKRPSPKKRFFFEDVNLKKETIQKTPKKNGRTKKRPKKRQEKNANFLKMRKKRIN